ncbi:ribosome small subunit-dependent GTPase A [Aerococcaceae bacterium DSM 111020]|nr:ribosome small subunit-dependent GTPase A [Aerococcaceae bacterium DSM 111020]
MQEKEIKKGIIYHALSGFYYVWADGEHYTTKPKGLFRHQDEKPLVGDYVDIEIDHVNQESEDRLIHIYPRENVLVRPPIANIDHVFIVVSLVEPAFSFNLLDTFLAVFEGQQIEPIIILTKYDLLEESIGQDEAQQKVMEINKLYQDNIGYQVLVIDGTQSSFDAVKEMMTDGVYVVAGQSGVGKSTLINGMLPELNLETAAISSALNRGRHTTRSVTLYPFGDGLLADTPGFSSLEVIDIEKEDLQYTFPEIAEASHQCKFRSCVHINEPKCHVKDLVASGDIAESRYQNYLTMYKKIENQKPIYERK